MQRAQAAELDILPNGNTTFGSGVLVGLTSGVWNSGFGFEALNHDMAGKLNTATGLRALFSDTGGSHNTATGVYALSDFQAKIGELEATIAAQLKEQAEQIQKVSAQIEASRSAPQVVLNNR
jgi:hypothetical protein